MTSRRRSEASQLRELLSTVSNKCQLFNLNLNNSQPKVSYHNQQPRPKLLTWAFGRLLSHYLAWQELSLGAGLMSDHWCNSRAKVMVAG